MKIKIMIDLNIVDDLIRLVHILTNIHCEYSLILGDTISVPSRNKSRSRSLKCSHVT